METINKNSVELLPDGALDDNSWQNPGEFPDFSGNVPKTNVGRLQDLLERVGFDELRRDDEKFKDFIMTTDKQDMHRFLSHINQNLREVSANERGFHEGRMFAGKLISPNRETQTSVLDYEIDALAQINNPRYRAASAYYIINDLHLFSDGNGRTSRTLFELLDSPETSISEQQGFLSHEDNRERGGTTKKGYSFSNFEKSKNIVSTEQFNELAMLGLLEKMGAESGEDYIFGLKDSLEARIKEDGLNVLQIYGGLQEDETGDVSVFALNDNVGFSALDDEEKKRVGCALRDGHGGGVTVAALAMLEFYKEKGQQNEFLERTKNRNNPFGHDIWLINIDPEEKEFYGNCECEDWSKDDFLHYASLAESIREQVLKTSVDIFISPDNYKFSGKNIADVATNAEEYRSRSGQ